MKFAWTSTTEATPGGESNAAIRSKQTGRRRLGLIARVTPARAMSREAAQGSGCLLLAIAAVVDDWRFDGVWLRQSGCSLSCWQPSRFVCSRRS